MQTRCEIAEGQSICAGLPDPNLHLLRIIRDWMQKHGRHFPATWDMSRPVEPFAQFCADTHEQAHHTPLEFRTVESYRALIADIKEQFELLSDAGYRMLLWRGDGQPYRNSQEMRADVCRNRRLFVYPTGEMLRDHPLAQEAKPGWCWNDVFRAVHDLVGHAATGFQFGPVGEENAFRFHATVQSAASLPALAAETRLQNCWVNFGTHLRDSDGRLIAAGEPRYVSPSERPYAGQKAFSPTAATIDCMLWRRWISQAS